MNTNTPALSVKDVYKTYDGNFEALKGISLDINEGDIFALLGPNGAGKSTLIGIITSLVIKTSGTINVFGIDIDKHFSKAKEMIGVVPQEFNFNVFETVEQIIINQAGYYGLSYKKIKDRLDFLLKELALEDKRHTGARTLSGGMKRRLMIARALIHSPKLLILDEPSASVDIELRRSMWNFITHINKNENTTIILTTHYLEEAEMLANNVAIIDKGNILVNTSIKELLKTTSMQTYILDIDTEIDTEKAFMLDGFQTKIIDNTTIEVELLSTNTINTLVSTLEKRHIQVHSIKPKENKLESLFIRLVGENK